MSFADKAIEFYKNLKPPIKLSNKISVMNPYKNEETIKIIKSFYKKFFNDDKKRTFIFGINPGRFGGGVTGIAFTDPIALERELGIKNHLNKKPELSCQFIYKLINEYGTATNFYSKYFITAVYPLALIKDDKNCNYYDNKNLFNELRNDIIYSVRKQIEFGADENIAYSLGKKNLDYLKEINEEIKFFKKLKFLEHPRYIMQYKRKLINYYISKYTAELS